MSIRSITALAGALVLAATALGCGSNSNSSSTASLTKPEFVKKANAICASGEKEIEGEFETFAKAHNLSKGKPPSRAEAEEAANTILIPKVEKQVKEIRALGAPEGESAKVDEILSAVEAAIEKAKQDPAAFIEEEGKGVFADANRMAREYGLTTCGSE